MTERNDFAGFLQDRFSRYEARRADPPEGTARAAVVLVLRASDRSLPSSLKPSPRPLTPIRKTSRRNTTEMIRAGTECVVAELTLTGFKLLLGFLATNPVATRGTLRQD